MLVTAVNQYLGGPPPHYAFLAISAVVSVRQGGKRDLGRDRHGNHHRGNQRGAQTAVCVNQLSENRS